MKIVRNSGFRLVVYVLGFICAVLICASAYCVAMRYRYFYEDEDFKAPYIESNSVKNEIYEELSTLQQKAEIKKNISDLEFDDDKVILYDYEDIVGSMTSYNHNIKMNKVTVEDLFEGKNFADELSDYTDAEGGPNTVYSAYSNMFTPKNNSYIRMTWDEYMDIIRNNCIRFTDSDYEKYVYFDESNDTNEFSEETTIYVTGIDNDEEPIYITSTELGLDDEDYERGMYKRLSSFLNDSEICEGDYFLVINDYLYRYQPNIEMISFDKYGNTSFSVKSMSDYVYFPYNESIKDIEDAESLDLYILASYIYRSDMELVYSTFNDYQKSKLVQDASLYYHYSYGANSVYSLDGDKVDNAWICNGEGLRTVKENADGYNKTFPEVCKLFKDSSDIYVEYDAKTGNIEQWYKNNKGEKVTFEYVSADVLKELTKASNNSFALGIDLSSENGPHLWDSANYSFLRLFPSPLWILIISSILFLTSVVTLIVGEPAKLRIVDKAPYIIWAGLYFGVIILGGVLLRILFIDSFSWFIINKEYSSLLTLVVMGLLVLYITTAALVMNVVRRVKCKKFFDGFVTVIIIKWIFRVLMSNSDRVAGKVKTVIFMIAFVLINIVGLAIICKYSYDDFTLAISFGLVAVDVFLSFVVFRYLTDMDKLLEVSRRIEAGELDAKVDTSILTFNSKEMGECLNNLGAGLSLAVESSIRDEKTKAELITNVSHDIKTPLTSIISYVDLLKKEEINNEKAVEYIEILDQKSQRLKQLILDLIEASKTSTGNIELECMNMNFVELLNQGLGEFEDKFEDANLNLVTNYKTDSAVIYADGRRVYRIIDNLLNNVVKYAQPGTRVYMDLVTAGENDENVRFSIKNVSKNMLNISAEELTERFVRGERSRNTEGSGLGLSIAKNLTELQGGKLEIEIDGDLFKVDVSFPLVKNEKKDENEEETEENTEGEIGENIEEITPEKDLENTSENI